MPSYFGYYCENEFCPDSCSSHGYCDRENLECHCDDHFFGDNCESKRNCGEHGIAVEYNDKDSLKKMNVTENITKDERVSNISSNQNEFKDFYKVFLNKDFENTNMNMNYYCRCAEGWEGERCDSRRGVEGCWEFGGGYKGCFAKEKVRHFLIFIFYFYHRKIQMSLVSKELLGGVPEKLDSDLIHF